MEVIEIDGSLLEEGGQVLRTCAAYASLLCKCAHVVRIRANRPKPGLPHQSLAGLRFLATLTNGTLEGAFLHSQEILFTPGLPHPLPSPTPSSPSYEVDVQTAGACSLILQISLPLLLFSPTSSTSLVVKGGTNVPNSPPIDHTKHVLLPLLRQHCHIKLEMEVTKRGFMPKGGGVVHVKVQPQALLPPICLLEKGEVVSVVSTLFGQADAVAVKAAVESGLQEELGAGVGGIEFVWDVDEARRTGGGETKGAWGLFLCATTSTGCLFGGSALGNGRKASPRKVAALAVQDLGKQLEHGGCTDEHLQDQLIIFMALADGVSEVLTGPISLHTETAIHFAHHMTQAKFTVDPVVGSDRNVIRCRGVGYSPLWAGRER